MGPQSRFITNSPGTRDLKDRLKQVIRHSETLDFLVGYFYFSGWQVLYETLKERVDKGVDLRIRVLIGMELGEVAGRLVEIENQGRDRQALVAGMAGSLVTALGNADTDNREFEEQAEFFVDLMKKGMLELKKTRDPVHAKLYIFHLDRDGRELMDRPGLFITGSSNLTAAGLQRRVEFNVELKDYGFDDAVGFFEELWDTGVEIEEGEIRSLIERRTGVTPFEAYVKVLLTYAEMMEAKKLVPAVERLLKLKGYRQYTYQMDAVNQGLNILEQYGGVVIADVVGLGKSVIAAMIAKNLGMKGLVLAPPGLIGEKNGSSGWWKYVRDFDLRGWEVESLGKLEQALDFVQNNPDFRVVIVDEAHRFRNQDTQSYELLSAVCKGRLVILLTATPFNNSPADIFSLLKLFSVPGRSGLAIDDDIQAKFVTYDYDFERLAYILRYHKSGGEQGKKARKRYKERFGDGAVDEARVRQAVRQIADEIRHTFEPVMIRRNRLDLKRDPVYKREVRGLSKVEDPKEVLFALDAKQLDFYDRVIREYFGAEGKFKGTIYQPLKYERPKYRKGTRRQHEAEWVKGRQESLYWFIQRLVIKRFESSFGAFAKTIDNMIAMHDGVLKFLKRSDYRYVLDRRMVTRLQDADEEEIEEALKEFVQALAKRTGDSRPDDGVYEFSKSHQFVKDVKADLRLLERVKRELDEQQMVERLDDGGFEVLKDTTGIRDPKAKALVEAIRGVTGFGSGRKVVVFSEYVDTVRYLQGLLKYEFNGRVLAVPGDARLTPEVIADFDASVKQGKQTDQYDILLTSDRLSEGINLNRAGAVFNYDIPWNPVRVIQRVGRINRIGKKVFDSLYIYNFFPTEKGRDKIKAREIAAQKLFMIHQSLGEDSKIFAEDETPSPSALYQRIQQNPDEIDQEESLLTRVRQELERLRQDSPQVLERVKGLFPRVKTAKPGDRHGLFVFRRKGLGLFVQKVGDMTAQQLRPEEVTFEAGLDAVKAGPDTPRLVLSDRFWEAYQAAMRYRQSIRARPPNSVEQEALNNLISARKHYSQELVQELGFIDVLIEDLKNYYTLPRYTLRRLRETDMTPETDPITRQKKAEAFKTALLRVKGMLGEDYLDRIKARTEALADEVIISVENRG